MYEDSFNLRHSLYYVIGNNGLRNYEYLILKKNHSVYGL